MTTTLPPEPDFKAMIEDRLATIDERLDRLTAERTRVNDEIRTLREERVPLQRLARAAAPRTPKAKNPNSIQGVVTERSTPP